MKDIMENKLENISTNENNVLSLTGVIKSFEVAYVSDQYEEKFYEIILETPRLSEKVDELSVICPERVVYDLDLKPGDNITINGQIRSRKTYDEEGNRHFVTYGYATEVMPAQDLSTEDKNFVCLKGRIKLPIRLRKSHYTKKVIADLLLSVNRGYDKINTIPCVVWGKDALALSDKCREGDKISVVGRFQSRRYFSKKNDQYQTVYEVSVNSIEVLENSSAEDTAEEIQGTMEAQYEEQVPVAQDTIEEPVEETVVETVEENEQEQETESVVTEDNQPRD